eukprot:NODE_14602_length_1098_cov_5.739444.p2 GENE.NODE_14602_length_1098_cov_5.739444~~NODE_14602_length_1098_cov_5.739444.p2  ORF type:complete len:255 (+),score=76.08 NODE_14602_length_1098_cov_5.739444:69-767(+)
MRRAALSLTRVTHHPAALRNRGPILGALQNLLPADAHGRALEVASGTGAHIELFAPVFTSLKWQPSEYCPPHARAEVGKIGDVGGLSELEALDVVGCKTHPNVLPAVALDASKPWEAWPSEVTAHEAEFRLVVASNVAHITPWAVTLGLIAGAARALRPRGLFVLYGSFKEGGQFSTESNAEWDAEVRARNAEWGVRDADDVDKVAMQHGLQPQHRRNMPANNLLLCFEKIG